MSRSIVVLFVFAGLSLTAQVHAQSEKSSKPITTFNDPAFQQWVKDVTALPPERQLDAVAKKLQELNPGFDGKIADWDGGAPKIENGVVTDLKIASENVTDIAPVRALAGLKILNCSGVYGGKLSDLSPLEGMQLVE